MDENENENDQERGRRRNEDGRIRGRLGSIGR